jgi:hypothetical protein
MTRRTTASDPTGLNGIGSHDWHDEDGGTPDPVVPVADDANVADGDPESPMPPAAPRPAPAIPAAAPAPRAPGDDLATARAVSAAGTGLQAGAEVGGGVAAWYAGRTNRAIADFNARIADYKAIAAANRGRFVVNQVARRTGELLAGQATAAAANGSVAGAGTNAAVAASTAGLGLGDQATARLNALMEAWGYGSAAAGERMQGDLAARAGTQALIGGALGAAGTAAGGFYRIQN